MDKTACKQSLDRDKVQESLSKLNPDWHEYLHDNIRRGVSGPPSCAVSHRNGAPQQTEPKTNPDGDVDLQGRSYSTFKTLPCPNCSDGILKPSVIFCASISVRDVAHHSLLNRWTMHSRREHTTGGQGESRTHSERRRSDAAHRHITCDVLRIPVIEAGSRCWQESGHAERRYLSRG